MSRQAPLTGQHDQGYRFPDSMGDRQFCPLDVKCIDCPLPVCGHDKYDKTTADNIHQKDFPEYK